MQSIEQNACSPARQRTFASPARHEQLSTLSDISKPIVEAGGRLVIENYMSDNDDDDSMIVDKKTRKQNGKKGKGKHVSECPSQTRIQSSDEWNDESDFSIEEKKSRKSNVGKKGKGKKSRQLSNKASNDSERSHKHLTHGNDKDVRNAGDTHSTSEQNISHKNASYVNEMEATLGELWREGHSGKSTVNTRTGEEMSLDAAMRATLLSMKQLLMKNNIQIRSQSKHNETQNKGNQNE